MALLDEDTQTLLLQFLLIGGGRTKWQRVMWPAMSVRLSRAGWRSTSLGCTDVKLMPRVQPNVSHDCQEFVACCHCLDTMFSRLTHFNFFFLTCGPYQLCFSVHSAWKEVAAPMRNPLEVRLLMAVHFFVTLPTQVHYSLKKAHWHLPGSGK